MAGTQLRQFSTGSSVQACPWSASSVFLKKKLANLATRSPPSPPPSFFFFSFFFFSSFFLLFLLPLLLFNPHPRIYLLISEGWGEERESSMWERNIVQLPSICTLTRHWTHNLGMCPGQESNLQPFGGWDNTLNNWATRPWEKPLVWVIFLRFQILIY